jgi:hypothetical protein
VGRQAYTDSREDVVIDVEGFLVDARGQCWIQALR